MNPVRNWFRTWFLAMPPLWQAGMVSAQKGKMFIAKVKPRLCAKNPGTVVGVLFVPIALAETIVARYGLDAIESEGIHDAGDPA